MRNEVERAGALEREPLWYKDAIIYELHVRSFYDSDADGIGDFPGLVRKLDHLQDLGVTAVWLLPFYPSPLKDDGYDIADYTDVHPSYGTLRDVRAFIREAHRRGLRVITELVCNHTSEEHPWFQRARRARPGTAARDFYVWSDDDTRYPDARVIFKDFEGSNWTWDRVAGAYYWHRFYAHQPDLNFDNPAVRRAITRVLDFWLDLGVDGLRLDAVPYLYEREGTNCENLSETHAYLKELRRHVDETYRDRMLLAEANQWPEDAVAYFGDGDECHMSFHFPLMPRLFMAMRMEDRFPLVDILAQTPPIPEVAQWALFLRNHDELTLEMVTDEERDYMYRVYTQDPEARINLGIRRRLAPLLGNLRRRIELMNGLLFSLPGTPVLYYGDEIGMGDNIYLGDRNGVRTPMQWSADRNAGFSSANRQRLFLPIIVDPEYHYESVNVEAQQANPHSLLWWTKRLIALRKQHPAFGRGSLELLHPENRKVLAYVRRYGDERILVVANLSRFVQAAQLDLSAYRDLVPVEIFGRTEFPPIGELPYFITLGPHGFYWFSIETAPAARIDVAEPPTLRTSGAWDELVRGAAREALGRALPAFLRQRRWFGGKARKIKSVAVRRAVPLKRGEGRAYITFVEVAYTEGEAETYILPLARASGTEAELVWQRSPQAVIARVADAAGDGILFDAISDPAFCDSLLRAIEARRRVRLDSAVLAATPTRAFPRLRGSEHLEPSLAQVEQSNNSVVFGERLILKLFRRAEEGVNPDLEIGRFLTETSPFAQIAPVAGSLELRQERGEPITVAILQGYVPNQGDAWRHALAEASAFLDRTAGRPAPEPERRPTLALAELPAPEPAVETVGRLLEDAALLGRRTAEMHVALAAHPDDEAFAPEPFTALYQRSVYQSVRTLAARSLQSLKALQASLPQDARAEAAGLLEREAAVQELLNELLGRQVRAPRIRVHGDYHLGQVLYTGHDFVIIDFEGEPARTLRERRMKRSPLRDVAGMLRSFDYAAASVLGERPEADPAWARFWRDHVSAAFLRGYRDTPGVQALLPNDPRDLRVLLRVLLLEKALYELGYELNNRPAWVRIPLVGIRALLDEAP